MRYVKQCSAPVLSAAEPKQWVCGAGSTSGQDLLFGNEQYLSPITVNGTKLSAVS